MGGLTGIMMGVLCKIREGVTVGFWSGYILGMCTMVWVYIFWDKWNKWNKRRHK